MESTVAGDWIQERPRRIGVVFQGAFSDDEERHGLNGKPGQNVDLAEQDARSQALTVNFVDSIGTIDVASWTACAATDNPFLSHAFLKALEDSGAVTPVTGWTPRYLTARDGNGRLQAVAPVYLKSNSNDEYCSDHAWALGYQQAGGQYYPKLLVGIPFAPVSGRRLLVRPGAPAHTAQAVIGALEHVARTQRLSSIHVTFPDEPDVRRFQSAGWLVRHDIQYEWSNVGYRSFADFLGALTARKRSNILHQRRAVADSGIRFRTLAGDRMRPKDWAAFVRLFNDLHQRRNTPQSLPSAFFTRLGEALADRLRITFADAGDDPVGAMLCVHGDRRIYLRNWGCVANQKFLHFEAACYRQIEYAIDHGYSAIEGGYGGDHKLERGFLPILTHTLHWFSHSNMRAAVDGFLLKERGEVLHRFAGLTARSPFKRLCQTPSRLSVSAFAERTVASVGTL